MSLQSDPARAGFARFWARAVGRCLVAVAVVWVVGMSLAVLSAPAVADQFAWTGPHPLAVTDRSGLLYSVSCPSTHQCTGVGQSGEEVTFDPGTGAPVGSLEEHLFKVVNMLAEIARGTGRTIPQVAINWVLQRPTVSSVIIGARNEQQLRDNLGAVGWNLSAAQVARLDAASETTLAYPYWHQRQFSERSPSPVK